MTYLSEKQIEVLLNPIHPSRVGKDGRGYAHIEAWDMRAHMIRVFGFCRWSATTDAMELVFESSISKTGKNDTKFDAWTVCYRAKVTVTICAPDGTQLAVYSEWATGDAPNLPSRADAHDMAIKTAESQSFKRCCVNIGDAGGVGLYDGGKTAAVVKGTLVRPDVAESDLPEPAPPTAGPPAPVVPTGAAGEVLSLPGASPAAALDDLRTRILSAISKPALAALSVEASQAGCLNAQVADADGNAMTVQTLLNQAIKAVSR